MKSPRFIPYAEKLKDPRWKAFRLAFIDWRHDENLGPQCDDCGEDTQGALHVHHRLYREGAEPWEYDYNELRLICADCHERIHKTEKRLRKFAISVRPHICYELNALLDELEELPDGALKIALAQSKNIARNLRYKNLARPTIRTMSELEQEYREGVRL